MFTALSWSWIIVQQSGEVNYKRSFPSLKVDDPNGRGEWGITRLYIQKKRPSHKEAILTEQRMARGTRH